MYDVLFIIAILPLCFVGILCISQLPAVLVGRFERRSVWPYDSLTNTPVSHASDRSSNPYAPPIMASIEPINLTPFAQEQLRQAHQYGFSLIASTADQCKKLVKVRYEFLISPDRKILAAISFGTILSIPVQTVAMMSRLNSDVFFTTLGANAACTHDLDQKRTEMLIPNGNFHMMLHFHERRCAVLGTNVQPFVPGQELQALYECRVRRYDKYDSLGLIHYLGNGTRNGRTRGKAHCSLYSQRLCVSCDAV